MHNLRISNLGGHYYDSKNYGRYNQLLKLTTFNRQSFDKWVEGAHYYLKDHHILNGLLHTLPVDLELPLEEQLPIIKLRLNSVCSKYNITNLQRACKSVNGFLYPNTEEALFLIYNDREYSENLNMDLNSLNSIIPSFVKNNIYGYTPTVEGLQRHSERNIDNIAFIGIDVVELWVGWFIFLKRNYLKGISVRPEDYLSIYPLKKATLMTNQLMLINGLHDLLFEGNKTLNNFKVKGNFFNIIPEDRAIKDYLLFMDKVFKSGRKPFTNHYQIKNLYIGVESPLNLLDRGNLYDKFNSCRWVVDAMVLRLFKIYLGYANLKFIEFNQINTDIEQYASNIRNNYKSIPSENIRNLLYEMIDEVIVLNKENKK